MQYDQERNILTASVDELTAHHPREADLGGTRPLRLSPEKEKAARLCLAGAAGSRFVPDMDLCHTCRCGEVEYHFTGRADGIIYDEAGVTVTELIPLHSRAYYSSQPAVSPRLLCLAYFCLQAEGLPCINTQTTYYNPEKDACRHTTRTYSAAELESDFAVIFAGFARFADLFIQRETRRIPAIRTAAFPYGEMRPGQDELALAVFRAIRRGERLFVQAPTGIGKTMSTLYPAAKALGEGKCDRIFYLTAKGSTAREAWSAARRLAEGGAPLRTVMLSAREQMCLCGAARADRGRLHRYCNPFDCPYAAGYYRRSPDALHELLTAGLGVTSPMIRAAGEKHRVCPYELSLDLSAHCELIICDYNYLFDPHAYLRRFFGEDARGRERYVFLVDEAHNLPDRARAMYSAELRRSRFVSLYARIPGEEKALDGIFEGILRAFHRFARSCRGDLHHDAEGKTVGCVVSADADPALKAALLRFTHQVEDWLAEHREHSLAPALEELCGETAELIELGEAADKHFRWAAEFEGDELRLRLLCLDPAERLRDSLALGQAAVFFSATLTPTDYFAELLSGGAADVHLSLPSPYPTENLCLVAIDRISTRYADREESVPRIVQAIAATVSAKAGHYMVYFPSYAYMEAVFSRFTAKYPQVRVRAQKRGMDAAARDAFIADFAADDADLLVGFCVLGGSFSEGLDLPGNALIGTVIVGVGIPRLSVERGLLSEYYDERSEQGYAYAYTYPGMNKVLQAAGRVIRREQDRGIVVLIDDRYGSPEYVRLFPPHWSELRFVGDVAALRELARKFWANEKN